MANISTRMAKLYIKSNHFESAVKTLQLAAEYAIKFDMEHIPIPYKPSSSLLFKNNTKINFIIINKKENATASQLKLMKESDFDFIRNNKKFMEIEEKLESMQKKDN